MNIDADIRNLGKWLNEEQTAPIDRQALARLLAWAQMADKPAAWVYPEFFEGITKAGCWTAYAGDGSAAADGVKRIPLYRGAQPSQLHTGCHRSHPHENMDSMCKLRTEIARLANENARLKAQQQEPVAFYVYKPTLPHGNIGAVANDDLPWVYDQDPSSGFSARMLVTPYTSQPVHEQDRDRVMFERHWRKTRGEKKANRELPRHPLQPQTYIQDSANRHWVTWQAAIRYAASGTRVDA